MKNSIYKRGFAAALIATSLLASCGGKQTGSLEEKTPPKTVVQSPAFSPDSAYNFVAAQVAFGPRVPATPAHKQCGDYLIQTLEKYGATVQVQEFEKQAFDGTMLKGRNIFGSFNPEAKKRILLAAHWDTRPFADQDDTEPKKPIDGANDGGSGVAVMLEILRTMQSSPQKPTAGVDFLFFDLEDYGAPDWASSNGISYCLGSQYWSANKMPAGYRPYLGVLLDMVGNKNAKFAKEGQSMAYAPMIVEKVWRAASEIGYGGVFVNNTSEEILDDHYFVNTVAQIPMIDIIEYDNSDGQYFSSTWHTHDDNLENIDKNSLKAVGQTLLHVIYNE